MQRAWQKVAAGQRLFRARRTTVVSWRAVALRRRQFLFQLMDLLTERRLRDVLALRRVREATFLRDSDKVPQLMNLHHAILSCERRFVEAAIGVRAHASSSQPQQSGRFGTVAAVYDRRKNKEGRML